jgi:hypothetical protein
MTRAQTELPAVGIALVLLTGVLVLGIGAADSALSSADRPTLEQQAAVGLSEQLTAPSANVTRRANTLDPGALANLSVARLESAYGANPGHDIRIRLDGETLVQTGDTTGGTTIERLVVVEHRTTNTLVPALAENRTVTLPQRASAPTIGIDPPATTTVKQVWADDRLLLRNSSGLDGFFQLSLSPFETEQLDVRALGPLPTGSVTITHDRIETEKQILEVTVDV